MASSDLNLNDIGFQSRLRAKTVQENFKDIENNYNALRSEVNVAIASTASEITSARDNFGNLSDNIHARIVYQGDWNTGGVISAQGTPDNTVRVTAGSGIVGGVGADWVSGTSATLASPLTANRLDVAVFNTDNTISVALGNTGTDPVLPVIGNTQRPLYLISQDTAAPLTIATGDLTDIRGQGAWVKNHYFWSIQGAINSISEGAIIVKPGRYFEELDLSGKSNISIIFNNGAILNRPDASSFCIKSVNTVSNEETNISIIGGDFRGNGKAGAFELIRFEFTDKSLITGCILDGNASSTATNKEMQIENCDDFNMNDIVADFTEVGFSTITGIFKGGEKATININEGSNPGILLGDDTNLYRDTTNLLKTDDKFETSNAGGKDTINLSNITLNTGISIGGDSNLFRSAANQLKTDDSVRIGGELIVEDSYNPGTNIIDDGSTTEDAVFDTISPFIPSVGNKMMVWGAIDFSAGSFTLICSHAERISSSRITFRGMAGNGTGISTISVDDTETGSTVRASITW